MMSRQHPRTSAPSTSENHYQGGNTLPLTHSFKNVPPQMRPSSRADTNYHLKCTGSIRGNPCPLEHDECFTDEAFTEHNYYDYYDQDDHGYQTSPNKLKDSRTEFSYSDESDSVVMIPYYEYDDANRRQSRHLSERGVLARQPSIVDGRARVYPSEIDRLPAERNVSDPQQMTTSLGAGGLTTTGSFARRAHGRAFSRISTRSMDEPTTDIVHGCGGKCQTLENVCYYFLQVAFTMGVLIGVSLAIAGWVLHKSASRNLQVLLYIGALLAMVCGLLLRIQCNARKSARLIRRLPRGGVKPAAHIPMDFLPSNRDVQLLPTIAATGVNESSGTQRGVPVTLLQLPSGSGPVLQVQRSYDMHAAPPASAAPADQQGIPWWRRKDMV